MGPPGRNGEAGHKVGVGWCWLGKLRLRSIALELVFYNSLIIEPTERINTKIIL